MSKIEPAAIMERAAEIKDAMMQQAGRAASAAGEAAKNAAPKVIFVVDKTLKAATPVLDTAGEQAVKVAELAGAGLEKAHHDMMNDYLPRLTQVVEDAAGKTGAAYNAGAAPIKNKLAKVEEKKMKKKKHRCRKALKWTVLAAGVAAAGYLLWRRSQPIEDPWAEEYWADLETTQDANEVPAEVPTAEADKGEAKADDKGDDKKSDKK